MIDYTIRVTNTGNVTLYGVTLVDTLIDGNGNQLTIDTSAWLLRDIEPGETEIYSAYYLIEQNAADSGSVVNTVVATGTDPSGTTITENSDDPETLTKGDPTIVEMDLIPSIEVIKTANVTDTNSDNKTGINDIITYTIKVENNGNTDLTGLALVDVMTDLNGDLLSLSSQPVYMGSNLALSLIHI